MASQSSSPTPLQIPEITRDMLMNKGHNCYRQALTLKIQFYKDYYIYISIFDYEGSVYYMDNDREEYFMVGIYKPRIEYSDYRIKLIEDKLLHFGNYHGTKTIEEVNELIKHINETKEEIISKLQTNPKPL